MKLLRFNQDGCIYVLNMTLLVITYFIVRILPLPLVLRLYASKSGTIVEGSIYQNITCVIRTFTLIPIQCKLGCMVFYSLQIYWFYNITRNWIQVITKQVMCGMFHRGDEQQYFKRDLKNDKMYEMGKKKIS